MVRPTKRIAKEREEIHLGWLGDLISVDEMKSLRKAAESRGIGQSVMSEHIKNLEDWYGAQLVKRGDTQSILTPYGEAVARAARIGMAEILNGRERFARLRHPRSVSFAALHAIAIGFFPEWISTILKDLPSGPIGMMAENTKDCLDALRRSEVDFFICYDHPERTIFFVENEFKSAVIGEDELIPLIKSGDGPQEQKLKKTIVDAFNNRKSFPLLSYSDGTFLGHIVNHVLLHNKLKRKAAVVHHADLAEVLKALARNGHGVAWLPKTAVGAYLQFGQLLNLLDPVVGIRNGAGLKVLLPIRLFWKEPLTEHAELIAAKAKLHEEAR